MRRGHWLPDRRLISRTLRVGLATIGMGGALLGGLVVLQSALAHPDLLGVVALFGLCAAGGLVYGALGALIGVVRLSELRGVLRRQPGVRPADPTEQP
jgi:putative peptidoglycan lipid II flippase